MKEKKSSLLQEIFTEQMNHWMIFPVALTILRAAAGPEKPWLYTALWALLGICPLLLFFLRKQIHRKAFFLLAHGAAAIPLCFLAAGKSRELSFFAACCLGYLAYSLLIRLGMDSLYAKGIHPAAGVVVAVVSLLMAHYVGERGWDGFYMASLVFSLALFSLSMYVRRFETFLQVNESSAGYMPEADMFRSGFRLMAGYAAAGSILMVLAGSLTDLDDLFLLLWERLKAFFRDLIKSWNLPQGEETFPKEIPEDFPLSEGQFSTQREQPQQAGGVSQIVETVFRVALVVCAAFLVFFLVKRLIHFLREFWKSSFARAEEGAETQVEEIREKCPPRDGPRKGIRDLLAGYFNLEKRIRRLYRKQILAGAKELTGGDIEKLRFLTPRECGVRLSRERMSRIYERVRYSRDEATPEMLAEMKESLGDAGNGPEKGPGDGPGKESGNAR